MNYFKLENEETKRLFDIDKILDFQPKHNIQIIRGEDLQCCCYIDGKVYDISLTPLGAMVYGIEKYFKAKYKE